LTPPEAETDVPLSRANLRIYAEKHEFFRGEKLVSAYVERDKKIIKKKIFALSLFRK
jgi:hypothetical protein